MLLNTLLYIVSSLFNLFILFKMSRLMFVIVCLHIIVYVSAKPFFFYNNNNNNKNNGALTSLLASSSASASSASAYQPNFQDNPLSENIAIVPKTHIGKPMKLQLQQFNFTRSDEDNIVFPEDNSTQDTTQIPHTTTQTSFLQKKINKIIRKIVTISQIKNAILNYNTDEEEGSGFQYPEVTTEQYNYTVEPRENEIKFEELRVPNEEYGAPYKLNLQEIKTDNEELQEETTEQTDNKAIPAALGIFVLEMFASLVGLTVGAVNHINFFSVGQHNNTV